MYGGDGHDVLIGRNGDDSFFGGNGTDGVYYIESTASIWADLLHTSLNTGDAAGDRYDSIENLIGSGFNDTLVGSNGNNELYGGEGTDGAYYSGDSAAVHADLQNSASNTGTAAGDTYNSIENLIGTSFDDTLSGDSNVNELWGGIGTDTLTGRGGADRLYGGSGSDHFQYNSANETALGAGDTIFDFDATDNSEVIFLNRLLNGSFNFLGASSVAFTATGNTEARFNDASDLLSIDLNGNGTADMEITLTGVNLSDLGVNDFDF